MSPKMLKILLAISYVFTYSLTLSTPDYFLGLQYNHMYFIWYVKSASNTNNKTVSHIYSIFRSAGILESLI